MSSLLARLNTDFEDATATVDALRTGRVTATQVLECARRAAESGRSINAFVTEDWEGAEVVAAAIDARRAAGESLGVLAGVPFSVKDVIAVAGLPATAASKAFADSIAAVTSPVVQRFLDADAVLIGKTNCPEFAFGTTCTSPLLGATANPRFPGVSPGGSSGGEAAALAAGISAFGIGTDFGGSLRWPAQCVGITALRPTAGLLAAHGQLPGAGGDMGHDLNAAPTGIQGWLQTIGPLARSVRDLTMLFEVMTDAPSTEPPVGDRLRVAWSDGTALGPVRREFITLMGELAEALSAAGHQVSSVPDVFADCLSAYNHLRAVEPMVDHVAAITGVADLISAANRRTIDDSLRASPADVDAAACAARSAQTAARTIFADHDIVLLPVAGGPACDPDGRLDIDGNTLEGWELMGQCRAVSLVGAPVVSLPVGLSANGLPLSVQVIAAPGHDRQALAFAAVLENLTGE
ncbi:amidase [Nocardia sp. NPDC058705]|uniref:amidase n=1 Tax=Nocardia sp. NPDC058705 TaxID=3346609 RepID=UPI0036C7AA05